MTKPELINTVIACIEKRFPGSIVVWTREGYPEHTGEKSNEQVFEAYGIPEEGYLNFMNYIRELKRTIVRPNGFSIMVHDLTMEETLKYRRERYEEEIARRSLSQCIPISFNIKAEDQWRPKVPKTLIDPTSGNLIVAA